MPKRGANLIGCNQQTPNPYDRLDVGGISRVSMKNVFTVIVPSKTICPLTRKCINGIRHLYPDIRIILLLDIPTTVGIEADVIVVEDCTIGAKRNHAVQLAQTPCVAFIDSDAVPLKGWLENGLELLRRSEIGIVTGPNLPFSDENFEQKLVRLANLSILISGPFCYEKDDKFDGFTLKASSCNLLIEKKLYQMVGGMNPELKAGEDLDISSKILMANKKIYFSRKVQIAHRNRMLKGFMLQRITYGFCDIEFFKGRPCHFLVLAPFLLQVFVCIGLLLSPFVNWFYIPTVSILILFFATILYESLRIGRTLTGKIMVAPYILIGNVCSGLGGWLHLVNPKYNIYNIYNNDQ